MGTSRAELANKPSMMSVAESNLEDFQGDDNNETKTMGLSAFKATQSGISQASLVFGKNIHNSTYSQVNRSTIR